MTAATQNNHRKQQKSNNHRTYWHITLSIYLYKCIWNEVLSCKMISKVRHMVFTVGEIPQHISCDYSLHCNTEFYHLGWRLLPVQIWIPLQTDWINDKDSTFLTNDREHRNVNSNALQTWSWEWGSSKFLIVTARTGPFERVLVQPTWPSLTSLTMWPIKRHLVSRKSQRE